MRKIIVLLSMIVLSAQVYAQQARPSSELPAYLKVHPDRELAAVLLASGVVSGTRQAVATTDDPDGCCIQSNGTGTACSGGMKEKACKADCEQSGCTAKWHAGDCQPSDPCH
jgi:hypothetical protein